MDGSIVLARLRECAAHIVNTVRNAPVVPMLISFQYIDRRTCPGMYWAGPLSALKIASSHVEIWI